MITIKHFIGVFGIMLLIGVILVSGSDDLDVYLNRITGGEVTGNISIIDHNLSLYDVLIYENDTHTIIRSGGKGVCIGNCSN